MDAEKVVSQLQHKYPGKEIIKILKGNTAEILCEIDPTSSHPEYSRAIAVIDRSIPHVHYQSKVSSTPFFRQLFKESGVCGMFPVAF